ncbi:MAG: DUF4184 family protein [Solirubrobacteraceae bacterium]|nr:DUF4184 family protein [Solirubrobacteraceae bacterium]
MPFTGSHPAAIVPFLRTGLVPSALVIGSMAPDLPYYLPLPVNWSATHSAAGVVGVDLVLGLIAFAVWQVLLAPVAVALAPESLRARLAPDLPVAPAHHVASVRAVALVVGSLLVGAATHVLVDEFTHSDRWGTEHIAWLAEQQGPLEGYRWLQYAGGVLGGALLVWVVWRWWRRTPPVPDAQRIPALGPGTARLVVGVVVACALAGSVAGLASADSVREALFLVATWGGGVGLIATLVCAAACRPRLLA